MSDIAVSVESVSKRFRLYHERSKSLKDRFLKAGRHEYEDLWALNDVSFEVKEGETIGILGHNGSGKSTLLKCITGVLKPTSGQVVARGKMAALLELGAGFQPELSGRDNVYLNGAMMGLKRREIDAIFDEIVEFSELEPFIDNQVKFYSSGMYVRLGFAVAVNVDPDILVVDEVLAVGDERFQLKCLKRIREFQNEGRTILVVTHNAEQIKKICDRAVVLSHGQMIGEGEPSEAVYAFRESMMSESLLHDRPELVEHTRQLHIYAVRVEHPGTLSSTPLRWGDPVTISVDYTSLGRVDDVIFDLEIHHPEGTMLLCVDSYDCGAVYDIEEGAGTVSFEFPSWPLGDGAMRISAGIKSRQETQIYAWKENAGEIEAISQNRRAAALIVTAEVSSSGSAISRSR